MHAYDLLGLKVSHYAWDVVIGAITYSSPSTVIAPQSVGLTGRGHYAETRW